MNASDVIVVDRREQGPWKPSYGVSCRCGNCGEAHVAEFSKGSRASEDARTDRCPHCEVVGRLVYGTAIEARALLAGKVAVNIFEGAKEFFPCVTGAAV